jgi:hypothetical protein
MTNFTTFFFEIVFRDIPVPAQTESYPVGDRSIIVEVEPDSSLTTRTHLPLGASARESAKALAPQFAIQVVQKDLPYGFEPLYSVTEIDQLPRDLHRRPAEFHGNRFCAWSH